MPTSPVDISVLGKILLSGFDELNSNKFKLAVIYSMMNGKSCDPAQLQSHVDVDDASFQRLSLRLKSLYYKAADEAKRRTECAKPSNQEERHPFQSQGGTR